jgi:hypothetical protein
VDLFLLRRAAALAFFDPEEGLVNASFAAASSGAEADCERGSVGCDVDGWAVCVSVLCAGCGREGVADKNGNNMKTVARVIQGSRPAVK